MSLDQVVVDTAHKLLALVAAVGQLLMGLLVGLSFMLAPPWAVLVLVTAWVVSTVWATRTWRRHRFAALIPVAAMVVFWVTFLNLGDVFLEGFGA